MLCAGPRIAHLILPKTCERDANTHHPAPTAWYHRGRGKCLPRKVKQVTQLVSLGRRLEIWGFVPTASPVTHTPNLGSIQLISRVTEDSSRPGAIWK